MVILTTDDLKRIAERFERAGFEASDQAAEALWAAAHELREFVAEQEDKS